MLKATRFLFFVLMLSLTEQVSAQYDQYAGINESGSIDSSNNQKLYLSFSNWNYLRNHEYFGKILDGYTLFGTQLNPRLTYFPNSKLRVDGGIFLDKEFGRDEVKVLPTFTVKWNEGVHSFVFGTIEGNINHRFVDPIYDYERVLTNRNEYGLQWLVNNKWLWSDLFINWEHMIHRGDTSQEQFTAGLSTQITLISRKGFYLKTPLQGYLRHTGGQVNVTTKNLSTLGNTAVGLSIGKKWDGALREIRADAYYAGYADLSPNPGQDYKNGDGLLASLLLKSKWNVDLMLTYWNSHEFLSPLGNPLYDNSSFTGKAYFPPTRELIFFRVLWDKKLFDHFYAHFRLEPYYSLDESLFEYSYSLFITYRHPFLLKNNLK